MANQPPADRRRNSLRRWMKLLAPLGVGAAVLGAWAWAVWWWRTPEYIFPGPAAVARAMVDHRAELASAWLVTFQTVAMALALAVAGGAGLALLFRSSRIVELSLMPYAVILQVTPLVALAPLLQIWLSDYPTVMTLVCAWIVAFFPMLANTVVGLHSEDPGLKDLMRLYDASPWQRVRLLMAPSALPYFLAGLRVSVNLALVGAVVAEFVTGVGVENPGLASTVFDGQMAVEYPRAFAALALISATGIAMNFAVYALSRWLLRGWHESGAQ